MSESTETSPASKSVQELKIDEAEFYVTKKRLVAEKMAIQIELAALNAKCSIRLSTRDFHRIQNIRGEVVKQLMEKEQELATLNAQRQTVNAIIDVKKYQAMGPGRVKELVEVRDRWHDFSMDSGNHQKAREAAWKFSQELGAILKLFFDSTAPERRET